MRETAVGPSVNGRTWRCIDTIVIFEVAVGAALENITETAHNLTNNLVFMVEIIVFSWMNLAWIIQNPEYGYALCDVFFATLSSKLWLSRFRYMILWV
jgi:hypothetical protein